MINRICPDESVLSAYLVGHLNDQEKESVERHLASCPACRELLKDTNACLARGSWPHARRIMSVFFWRHIWLAAALLSLVGSFVFRGYFIQFIAAFVVFGVKWVIDAKAMKVLIMIREAWKGAASRSEEDISFHDIPDKK